MQAQSIQAQTVQGVHAAQSVAPSLERSQRHSYWTIALHWSSVLAIVISVVSVLSRELIVDDALRGLLMTVHRQTGVFVMVALGLRLVIRFGIGMADHAGDMPLLLRAAAQLAHLALYAMLLTLPILGLAVCNAHGVDVSVFGLFQLPSLVAADPDLADELTDYHVWAAWGLLALVSAHVVAALWHHAVRRDGVLVAMLPALKRR